MNVDLPSRSIYVAPEAVNAAPEYARRLATEAGIDAFVLRVGFDPASARHDDLERAADAVREIGARPWLLVGTWWGHGLEPGEDAMRPFADDLVAVHVPAHEAQWRMATPGGPADETVVRALTSLSRRIRPDGICLTHARYRHPASPSALFEVGEGAFRELMAERRLDVAAIRRALGRVERGLQDVGPSQLQDTARANRLPDFLDLMADTDVFSRWFRLRADLVTRSLLAFRRGIERENESIHFGTNAYGPIAALECGEDYAQLVEACDFVQPLLGYVGWHVVQPVHAWRAYLAERSPGVSMDAAHAIAAALFGLADTPLAAAPEATSSGVEIDGDQVTSLVARQLSMLEEENLLLGRLLPVLNGHGWPEPATRACARRVEASGYAGTVYQGTEALVGTAPSDGWA